MNASDYCSLQAHFRKISPAHFVQAPRTKPEEPKGPPDYPAPVEIPDPTEIPPPVPGDTPVELPGPEENPAPEIEPPKERFQRGAPFLEQYKFDQYIFEQCAPNAAHPERPM